MIEWVYTILELLAFVFMFPVPFNAVLGAWDWAMAWFTVGWACIFLHILVKAFHGRRKR